MKVTRSPGGIVLHFASPELQLFLEVLKFHPQVPHSRQPLSKSDKLPDREANQRLLDEALAEHRTQNRKLLDNFLTDPKRIKRTETGARVAVSADEIEWLLQVLNEIRVGSWIKLGSPDELRPPPDETVAPHYVAMELTGMLQGQLLSALEGGDSPPASYEA